MIETGVPDADRAGRAREVDRSRVRPLQGCLKIVHPAEFHTRIERCRIGSARLDAGSASPKRHIGMTLPPLRICWQDQRARASRPVMRTASSLHRRPELRKRPVERGSMAGRIGWPRGSRNDQIHRPSPFVHRYAGHLKNKLETRLGEKSRERTSRSCAASEATFSASSSATAGEGRQMRPL
jgi:hypothetical protein